MRPRSWRKNSCYPGSSAESRRGSRGETRVSGVRACAYVLLLMSAVLASCSSPTDAIGPEALDPDTNGPTATQLDAFVVNQGENTVYLGAESGEFQTPVAASANTDTSLAVALGDLNANGNLDAFVVNDGPNFVYWAQGNGTFTIVPASDDESISLGVALGNLQGP